VSLRKPDALNILGRLPCTIYRFDVRRRVFTHFSSSIDDLSGYTVEELLNETPGWFDLVMRKERPYVRRHTASSDSRTSSFEYRIKHRSGRVVWVLDQSTVSRAKNGSVWRDGMFVSLDMTGFAASGMYSNYRRMKEELTNLDLQFRLNQFRHAIDAATIVSIADLKGVIKYANEKFVEVSGYGSDELLGKKHSIINSGHHPREFWRDMWRTISCGKIWRGEVKNKRKDGTHYWVDTFIIPLRNRRNKISEYLSIRNDITDKKENEIRLTEALQKAKESERLKSAFLANISHEIRTPMNAIMGFAELLTKPRSNFSAQRRLEFTRHILERSKDLLNVVNNILDISKIEAGQVTCVRTEGNLHDVFDQLLQRFKAEILHLKRSRLAINVVNELSDKEGYIVTDFQRLTQILHNLLTNAAKFTQDGTIEFGCRLMRADTLEFWVKDTGIGIREDKIETIFLPFRQADETIHMRFGGSGLGLAISKGFVELLGGSIRVESSPGKGSAFYFTIPYAPAMVRSSVTSSRKTSEAWTTPYLVSSLEE
jgi:PAS domain S-box-containing protein